MEMLPHNCQAILQQADSPLKVTSRDLYPCLHDGVFLNQKKKKYWADKQSSHNCFMLYARGLSITWGDDKRYWRWDWVKEAMNVPIEVAVLLNVCWLEVRGALNSSFLSPGATYEIVFVVKMEEDSYGWNAPVNLRLETPDGEVHERKEKLLDKPKNQWIGLRVGYFENPNKGSSGEIKFSLFEHKDGKWKKGLIIKGVIIRPMKCKNMTNIKISGSDYDTLETFPTLE